MHLLTTKLYIPPIRSSHLARPRLINLINSGADRALTLVSAPAGYGKTTLASTWLIESKIPYAWLSLDSSDNDPNRFLQYLFAALQPIAPGIEIELSGMLQGIQPIQFENVINLLANELATVSDPFVLVLDDFHIIQSEAVLKIVSYLLDHLPNQMHIAILTRTDPPLPLARLRVRGQLLDIRAEQLRFTYDEIAVFLNEVMELPLSASDLSGIEARTEGWIAGLQLAAVSMRSCKDIHGFVSAFTGSHHYVMDYLVEEVLRHQGKQVSTFLLQTSILERLCGPLCEAVVDANADEPLDRQGMLEALEELNLFTIPLDEERHWYRYHHLFADVLRKRLSHQFPDLLPELHRRASRWYEQNEFIAESIQHAILAGDEDRAAQLIEQNGCFLLMSGEVATLLNWADAIEFNSEVPPMVGHSKSLGARPQWRTWIGSNQPCKSQKNCSLPSNVRSRSGRCWELSLRHELIVQTLVEIRVRLLITLKKRSTCCQTAVPSLKVYEVWLLQFLGMPAGLMEIWKMPSRLTTKPFTSVGRPTTFIWSSSPTQILLTF